MLILAELLLLGAMGKLLAAEKSDANPTASVAPAINPVVVAYYFHGTVRCETCLQIEKQSRDVIERRFIAELAAKRLVFQSVNYDLKENFHFMQDYRLPFPSLVLVRQGDGKDVRWKLLGETWELVTNSAAFGQYVQKEVTRFLNLSDDPSETNSPALDAGSESAAGTRVSSLVDLDNQFGRMSAAFVFVQKTNSVRPVDWKPINRARRTVEAGWDIKLGSFELTPTMEDYRALESRLPAFHLPTVMVLLHNGSRTMLSGAVTETNLVDEFRYAVSAAGCCPLGDP